jgi:serine/threonine protein phosphatase PrpC
MKFADPLALKNKQTRQAVLFAGSQLQGGKTLQEDFFINFNDECVVVSDGVSETARADIASELASETAIWGYKHIRQRPFYWADKKLFLKRIFRSVNMTIWQKQREHGFEQGLATTLSVAMIGTHALWVGSVGDTGILLFREGLIDVLTPPDVDELGRLTNWLGKKRLGLVPHIAVEKFLPGDILLLATDGVLNHVSEDQLRATFEVSGSSTDSLTTAVVHLLKTAQENGSEENMTACMIKKVRTGE